MGRRKTQLTEVSDYFSFTIEVISFISWCMTLTEVLMIMSTQLPAICLLFLTLQQPDGHLQAIIAHLSGRQISEACQVAQNAGDDRLALLLAQAAGSSVVRQMVMVQLAKWAEMKVKAGILMPVF